ncbi:MAG TPA: hypothetical protein VHZ96_00075 [Frankiaceae bacterium]|jgi:hypothetical protein|nr:hypothetical protein [Frankiaceae bacterium]
MSNTPTDHREGSGRYEIQVRGHLAARWDAWFDGFTLTRAGDGTTVLTGFVVDQAALHGLLRKIADLGVPLISVTPTASA